MISNTPGAFTLKYALLFMRGIFNVVWTILFESKGMERTHTFLSYLYMRLVCLTDYVSKYGWEREVHGLSSPAYHVLISHLWIKGYRNAISIFFFKF